MLLSSIKTGLKDPGKTLSGEGRERGAAPPWMSGCVGFPYLCVGLVVLAVISGGVGAVGSCGRSRGAVSEGARALGGGGGS